MIQIHKHTHTCKHNWLAGKVRQTRHKNIVSWKKKKIKSMVFQKEQKQRKLLHSLKVSSKQENHIAYYTHNTCRSDPHT